MAETKLNRSIKARKSIKKAEDEYNRVVVEKNGDIAIVLKDGIQDVKEALIEAKKEVISKAFEHVYENFVYFINVIIDNHREDFVEEIYDGFMDLYNREMKIKIVKVISKDKLTDEEYNRLFSALTSHFSEYQIIVENEIDDTIISGYKIYADGSSIDFSINKLIANYKSQF